MPPTHTELTHKETASLTIHLRFLFEEAFKRGYRVFKTSAEGELLTHFICLPDLSTCFEIKKTNIYPDLTPTVVDITKHKQKTTDLLTVNSLPVPKSYSFSTAEQALNLWKSQLQSKKAVVKPENEGMGSRVHVDLVSQAAVLHAATDVLSKNGATGVIQEHLEGSDLRIQAVDGKLFAACIRVPAHVIGDGKSTISELIAAKSKLKLKQHPDNGIKVTDTTLELLKEQVLSLDSIPKDGRYCHLQKAANISLGGDAVDVTDQLNKDFYRMTEQIARLLKIKVFAIDLITQPTLQKITDATLANSAILEVNAPCMWAHHHFAVGKKRNVAAALLDCFIEKYG